MGASLEFKANGIDEMVDTFRRLVAAGEDTTPLMDEMGAYLQTSVDRRFESEQDPDGNAWKPTHRGGAILQDSGRLRRSISRHPSKRKVRVGSNLIYAAPHQFGAIIKPKNGKSLAFSLGGNTVFAKQVTIPAREFLGINDDDATELAAIAGDYLADAMGAR